MLGLLSTCGCWASSLGIMDSLLLLLNLSSAGTRITAKFAILNEMKVTCFTGLY